MIDTFGYANGSKYLVTVQIAILKALPMFNIVGLGAKTVQESKERILAVMDMLKIKKPIGKIIVNLAPANMNKLGSHYDLPILIAFILKCGVVCNVKINEYIIVGELSLNGDILRTEKATVAALLAKEHNRKLICSTEDYKEVTRVLAPENVYAFDTIQNVIAFMETNIYIPPKIEHIINEIKQSKIIQTFASEMELYFLKIAAAGKHNIMFIGSPGVGKTTYAGLLHMLIPPLSTDESAEVLELYSYANIERADMYAVPFRSPHFTASKVALIGGGFNQSPGEISLAHNGILFLDEVCEFDVDFLNCLRTPLEENVVHISRANYKATYNANIILVLAANPCSCGYSLEKDCKCRNRLTYLNKIPGPIMNRVAGLMYLYRKNVNDVTREINIHTIHAEILNIYTVQIKRFSTYNAKVHADILIAKGMFDIESITYAKQICNQHTVSMRVYINLLRIARTVADIELSETVLLQHMHIARIYANFRN